MKLINGPETLMLVGVVAIASLGIYAQNLAATEIDMIQKGKYVAEAALIFQIDRFAFGLLLLSRFGRFLFKW